MPAEAKNLCYRLDRRWLARVTVWQRTRTLVVQVREYALEEAESLVVERAIRVPVERQHATDGLHGLGQPDDVSESRVRVETELVRAEQVRVLCDERYLDDVQPLLAVLVVERPRVRGPHPEADVPGEPERRVPPEARRVVGRRRPPNVVVEPVLADALDVALQEIGQSVALPPEFLGVVVRVPGRVETDLPAASFERLQHGRDGHPLALERHLIVVPEHRVGDVLSPRAVRRDEHRRPGTVVGFDREPVLEALRRIRV